ncbi:hypothetical protein ACKWTF_016194 [Chironomus riparius]
MTGNSKTNQNSASNKIDKSWTTFACENLNNDFDLIIQKINEIKVISSNSVLRIKIITANDTNELCSINVKKLQQKSKNKSIVIFVAAKDDKKFLIYWKSKDVRQVMFLSSYRDYFSEHDKDVCEFAAEFLVNSLQDGHLGINANFEISNIKGRVELHSLVDSRNYNLMLLAAESGSVKPIKTLLKYGIETQLQESEVTAQSLSYNGRHFDVLLELLQANLTFPSQVDVNECSEELKCFIETSEKFHQMIEDQNMDRLNEIIQQYSNHRYFYNLLNESAIKVALELDSLDIYEFLVSKNLSFAPNEDIDTIMNGLSLEKMKNISIIHKKYDKSFPEKHMTILMANSFVIQEKSVKNEYLNKVHQVYKEFNKDSRLKVILQTVAATKIFKIVFNFCRDSTFDSSSAPGSSHTSYRIDIPAKDLLNINTISKVYGTLAYELFHYALHAVYGNKANPYTKLDREAEKKFHKVLIASKQNKENEELIKIVFDNYGKNEQPSELIVRPAQLIAMYINQHEKLQKSVGNFPDLFDHFEIVMSEMERALPDIEARFVCKPTYVFSKLSEKTKVKLKNRLLNFKSVKVMLSELFPENSAIYELLTSDHILRLVKNENLNMDDPEFWYLGKLIEFKWENLPKILKDKFLNSSLNFQGQVVKFKKVYELYHEAFDDLTSEQINAVLSGDIISIGDLVGWKQLAIEDNNCKFYVERNFIPEDINLIYFEYVSKTESIHDEANPEECAEIISKFPEYYDKFSNQGFDSYYQNLKIIQDNSSFPSQDFSFNDKQFHFVHKNSIEIIEQAENARILILSSETGSGKTSTFKHLMEEVKKKCPFKWVANIDVKNLMTFLETDDDFASFIDSFGYSDVKSDASIENFDKNSKTFDDNLENCDKNDRKNSSENLEKLNQSSKSHSAVSANRGIKNLILEVLAKIIFNLNSKSSNFEVRIFQECLKSESLVLFWDHFEDIPLTSTRNFINLFNLIHTNTSNVQYISSNPSIFDKLSQSLKIRTWQLLPFDEDNKKEFLTKHFISQKIPNHKIEENIAKIEELMKNFNSNDIFVYDFDTPMILQLLSITDDHGKIFNYSQIYTIFETFIQHKIKDWLRISLENTQKSDLIDSLKIIFQKYALLQEFSLFSSTTLGLKMKKLQIIQKPLPQNSSIAEISTIKILIFNEKNNFKFVHKTISEFFVAQYFIENILNVNGYVDINEAELRLELFYHLMQNYGNLHQIITDFMSSYLNVRDKIKKKFNPTISILLRTKFKSFFIRMLDTNHPKIFEFLFEFFKSDHSLLVELLHIHEDETLYTAIFDPNYFGLFVDPEKIRELGEKCLTDEEFESFVNGKNQKGKIMFGESFYSFLGIVKSHEPYGSKFEDTSLIQWHNKGIVTALDTPTTPITDEQLSEASYPKQDGESQHFETSMSTNYWKFLQKLLKPQSFMQKLFTNPQDDPLTENDQKQLFMTAISPKIYLFYNKLFSTADFVEYKKLWTNFENLLAKAEMQEAIGNAMMNYFEICPDNKDGHDKFLYLLLKKAKKFLSNSQIYEMFMSKNILHEAFWDSGNFKILWTFLSDHSTKDERKQILLHDDLGDKNFYFFSLLNESKDKFSSHKFVYFFYDFTALKIIHRTMTTGNAPAFECVTEIYEKYLTKNEIQEIIMSSTDFLLYLIGKSNENSCRDFVNYLKKLFKGSDNLLLEFLDKKVQPTNLTIFEFIDDYKELVGSKSKWYGNLEILYNLYEILKANKM